MRKRKKKDDVEEQMAAFESQLPRWIKEGEGEEEEEEVGEAEDEEAIGNEEDEEERKAMLRGEVERACARLRSEVERLKWRVMSKTMRKAMFREEEEKEGEEHVKTPPKKPRRR